MTQRATGLSLYALPEVQSVAFPRKGLRWTLLYSLVGKADKNHVALDEEESEHWLFETKKRGSLEREIPVPYPTHNMNIKKGGCYNVPNVVWFDKGEEHWYESSISMMARSFAIPRAKEYEKKGYLVRKKGVWRRIIFGMWELKWVTSKEREIIDHLKDKNLAAYIYVGHGLKGDPAGGLKPELKGQGAVKSLLELSNDTDEHVSNAAIEGLAKIGEPAVRPLIEALSDKNFRCSAAMALARIQDKRAVDPLINMLEDEDDWFRFCVAYALNHISDKRVINPFIKVLKNDSDSRVCSEVIQCLGRIGGKNAIEPLIGALQNTDNKVKWYAAEALGKLADERAIEPLIRAFRPTPERGYPCFKAKDALIKIGKPAIKYLIRALTDDCKDVRSLAAETLGEMGDKTAVNSLINTLKDSDPGVRYSCLLYTSPSPRDLSTSRMPSSA